MRTSLIRAAVAPLAFLALAMPAPAARAELKVVATIKPVHALVAGVMAGVGTPRLLVSGTASPHSFAMKPSDARALAEADVFFRISESVEPFTERLVRALPQSVRVVTLAAAPGVGLLPRREHGAFETHVHAGHAAGAHPVEADVAQSDGHIWLDPENAKAMVAEIARVLAERSPGDAGALRANAAKVTAGLDALAAELAGDLSPVADRPFIVFHDATQYFERRFGLNAVGAITLSPEVQPSARRLSEVRRKIAELEAVCIFAEPRFEPQLVAAVTEGTPSRTGSLDPEGLTVEPGPDAYATLMRRLAAGLKECLEAPG